MTPNTNSINEINVYCDYLTDNNCPFVDEIRFEDPNQDHEYWTRLIYSINVGSVVDENSLHFYFGDLNVVGDQNTELVGGSHYGMVGCHTNVGE